MDKGKDKAMKQFIKNINGELVIFCPMCKNKDFKKGSRMTGHWTTSESNKVSYNSNIGSIGLVEYYYQEIHWECSKCGEPVRLNIQWWEDKKG